jgi:hypothetical protein
MAQSELKKQAPPTKRGGNRGGDRTRANKVKKRSAQAAGKDPQRNVKRSASLPR